MDFLNLVIDFIKKLCDDFGNAHFVVVVDEVIAIEHFISGVFADSFQVFKLIILRGYFQLLVWLLEGVSRDDFEVGDRLWKWKIHDFFDRFS